MTKQDRPQMITLEMTDSVIPVNLIIYERERAKFAVSFVEAGDALNDAARIFELLQDLVAHKSNVPTGLHSLLKVCGAHFGRMAGNEAEDLFRMAQILSSEAHQAETFRKNGGVK
jgi:hypothetical protein